MDLLVQPDPRAGAPFWQHKASPGRACWSQVGVEGCGTLGGRRPPAGGRGSLALGGRRESWGAGSGEARGPNGNTEEETESLCETYLERPVMYKRQRLYICPPTCPRDRHTRFLSPAPLRSQLGSLGVAPQVSSRESTHPGRPRRCLPCLPAPPGLILAAVIQNCPGPCLGETHGPRSSLVRGRERNILSAAEDSEAFSAVAGFRF